jgi:hypothetical protein
MLMSFFPLLKGYIFVCLCYRSIAEAPHSALSFIRSESDDDEIQGIKVKVSLLSSHKFFEG